MKIFAIVIILTADKKNLDRLDYKIRIRNNRNKLE